MENEVVKKMDGVVVTRPKKQLPTKKTKAKKAPKMHGIPLKVVENKEK